MTLIKNKVPEIKLIATYKFNLLKLNLYKRKDML